MAYQTRLTFNTEAWKNPSGAYGKCPGTANWEYRAGFGFEEWYRSEALQREDNGQIWQYGYWQCFKNPQNHAAGIYKNFTVYTRECLQGAKGNNSGLWYKVAHYKQVYVLTESERQQAMQDFKHQLEQIRSTLQTMGIDVHQYFDGQPDAFPQLNIRFMVTEETYMFPKKYPMPIKQGGARFGLYPVAE
jgi:hypothetical protein